MVQYLWAEVVELVDTRALRARARKERVGSTPALGTKQITIGIEVRSLFTGYNLANGVMYSLSHLRFKFGRIVGKETIGFRPINGV